MSKASYSERIGPLFLKRTQSKKGKINSKIFDKTDNKSHAQSLSHTHTHVHKRHRKEEFPVMLG